MACSTGNGDGVISWLRLGGKRGANVWHQWQDHWQSRVRHREDDDGQAKSRDVLLVLDAASEHDECLEAGSGGQPEQHAVLDTGPAGIGDGDDIMPSQLLP